MLVQISSLVFFPLQACYDQAKEGVASLLGDDAKNPGIQTKLGSSAIAGFTAAAFSLPFDLIKSRLMAMKPDASGKMPYTGVADCAVKIMRNEGPLGFYAGFSGELIGRCGKMNSEECSMNNER